MLSARSGETLADAATALRSAGADVATTVADITDPDTPALLVAATEEAFGTIDIVVATAAVGSYLHFLPVRPIEAARRLTAKGEVDRSGASSVPAPTR